MQSIRHRFPSLGAWKKRLADTDLLWIWALLWAVSLVRVVGAILLHEAFHAEATLALAVVLVLPWAVLGAHKARGPRKGGLR